MRAWLAIDPGMGGAVAVIYEDGRVEAFHSPTITESKTTSAKLRSGKNKGENKKRRSTKRIRDVKGRFSLLCKFKQLMSEGLELKAVIEAVHSMPRDGVTQAFSFGQDYGQWEMALVALKIPYNKVSPSVWRPVMVGKGASKAESLSACRRMYPDLHLPLAKDEARAEAVLIAEWQRRTDLEISYPKKK